MHKGQSSFFLLILWRFLMCCPSFISSRVSRRVDVCACRQLPVTLLTRESFYSPFPASPPPPPSAPPSGRSSAPPPTYPFHSPPNLSFPTYPLKFLLLFAHFYLSCLFQQLVTVLLLSDQIRYLSKQFCSRAPCAKTQVCTFDHLFLFSRPFHITVRFAARRVRVVSVPARLPPNYGTPGIPDDTLMARVASKLWRLNDSSNGGWYVLNQVGAAHLSVLVSFPARFERFEAAGEGHPAETRS